MQAVIDHIVSKIRERSQIQGHTLTGAFEAGLHGKVEETDGITSIVIYDGSGVGKYIDRFTPASAIPFSPGSGARTSKFIDGLKRYAELRFGLSDKEALGAAFAMAFKMKREGKPTYGSMKYSRNNSRTGVITDTIEAEKPEIIRMITSEFGNEIKIDVHNLITKYADQWR